MSYTYAQKKRTPAQRGGKSGVIVGSGVMENGVPNSVRLAALQSGKTGFSLTDRGPRPDLAEAVRSKSAFDLESLKQYEARYMRQNGGNAPRLNGFLLDASAPLDAPVTAPHGQPQIPRAEEEADRLSASVHADTPDAVKAAMGERLGADFSGVRFHTGADAVLKADAVGARAYTTGSDVYFGEGGFDASVAAHELVHTAQQGSVQSSAPVVSAPMGGVQRVPKWLKSIGKGIGKVGRALTFIPRKIGSALVGAKEFLGGKVINPLGTKNVNGMGLRTPSQYEANKLAEQGDFSKFAKLKKSDVKKYRQAAKDKIQNSLNENEDLMETFGSSTTDMLNPAVRGAMSEMSRDETLSDEHRAKLRETMESMDVKMMENTILGPGEEQRENLKDYYQNYGDQKDLSAEYGENTLGKMALGTEGKGYAGSIANYAKAQALTTASHFGAKRSDEDAQEMAERDIQRSQGASDSLLRTMFLMQMGNFSQVDEDKDKSRTSKEWDHTMANAFSHGSRTAFLFNTKDKQENGGADMDTVTDALFGENMGEKAGVHTRSAGTHHMKTPELQEGQASLNGTNGFEEKRGMNSAVTSALDTNYSHYGMDMAIGGIGNRSVTRGDGKDAPVINADGRNGHMYIGKRKSTDKEGGGLLMGLESDSPYRMNRTGHMHNAAAVAEEASSTGGMKTDLVGAKTGGRVVDLTGVSNADVAGSLNAFTSYFEKLRQNDQEGYKKLVGQMVGKRMGQEDFNDLMTKALTGEDGMSKDNSKMLDRIMNFRKVKGMNLEETRYAAEHHLDPLVNEKGKINLDTFQQLEDAKERKRRKSI